MKILYVVFGIALTPMGLLLIRRQLQYVVRERKGKTADDVRLLLVGTLVFMIGMAMINQIM